MHGQDGEVVERVGIERAPDLLAQRVSGRLCPTLAQQLQGVSVRLLGVAGGPDGGAGAEPDLLARRRILGREAMGHGDLLAGELQVLDDDVLVIPSRPAAGDDREAVVEQRLGAPGNRLLADRAQPVGAGHLGDVPGADRGRAPVDVVGVIAAGGIRAQIGVMQERDAVGRQDPAQLGQVSAHDRRLGMHQRVEAEHEVDRVVGGHGEGGPVVDEGADVRLAGEPLPAVRDRRLGDVDDHQLVAQVLEEVRPAPVAGSDLEDSGGRHEALDAGEQGRPPLLRDPAPGI